MNKRRMSRGLGNYFLAFMAAIFHRPGPSRIPKQKAGAVRMDCPRLSANESSSCAGLLSAVSCAYALRSCAVSAYVHRALVGFLHLSIIFLIILLFHRSGRTGILISSPDSRCHRVPKFWHPISVRPAPSARWRPGTPASAGPGSARSARASWGCGPAAACAP